MTASHWSDDRLNRKADADHLRHILIDRYAQRIHQGRIGAYILNLDAGWGQGKTFFLDRLKKDLESDGYPVACVNAWHDDLADEPIVSIMASIDGALAPHLPEHSKRESLFREARGKLGIVAIEASKQIALHGLKVATGISVGKIVDRIADADLNDDDKDAIGDDAGDAMMEAAKRLFEQSIDTHRKTSNAIAAFKGGLAKTIEAITNNHDTQARAPLFVLIDELDRCRPLYAIKLLENAKHLFEVQGVVFIIATDSTQLAASIRAVYGETFDAIVYLRRFFDRTYTFPHADRALLLRSALAEKGIALEDFATLGVTPQIEIVSQWIRGLGISLRDIEQMADLIETFVTSWQHPCKINLFLMLINIWSFYNRSRGTWVAFAEYKPEQLREPAFEGWMVSYAEASVEAKMTLDAKTLFTALCSTMAHHSPPYMEGQRMWEDYLADPSAWGPEPMPATARRHILREYASRAWNAGRAIGRPNAY